jgi:hypothetical protein
MIAITARVVLGAALLTFALAGWRAHGIVNQKPFNGYVALACAFGEATLIYLAGGWGF